MGTAAGTRTWYRWVVLAVGTLAQAATAAVLLGLPSVTPALREFFGLDLVGVGTMLSVVVAGTAITLLPWGSAADRFGERGVMTIGLASGTIVLGLVAFIDQPVPAGVLLALAGAAGGSVNAASGRAVMTWFAAHERGLAMAVRQTAIPLGAAVAAGVLPHVASASGVPAVFGVLAVGCGVAAAAVAAGIREPPDTPLAPGGIARATAVLRDPRLLRISLAGMLLIVPQFLGSAFLVEVLVTSHGIAMTTAGVLLALSQVLAVLGRLGCGLWSDRTGSRLRPLRTVAVMVAVGFAAVAVAATTGSASLLAAVLIPTTALATSWNNLVFTAAGELAPPGRAATAMAMSNTANHISAAVTPAVGGALAQQAGWPVVFTLGILTALAGLAALHRVGETSPGTC